MNKRSKLWAIVASGVLTLGIAGIALAEELLEGQVGNKMGSYTQECDKFPAIGEGEIGVHFILNQTTLTSAELDAVFSTDSFDNLLSAESNANALHWYAVITGDADTTILSAHVDGDWGNLVVSHTCVGEETSSTTSFSSSEESSTTSVNSTTSFSSSEKSSTTSFSSSEQSSTTSSVTTPPTDTIFDGGSGNQATGMWLLVAALGVLLGSLVVVAPARAKR